MYAIAMDTDWRRPGPLMTTAARADTLRHLHRKGEAVVVPNAWDAASARALALLHFPTIATSSAAVAWTAGYPDGQRLPFARLLESVRAMTAAIDAPLSVDAEGGFIEETGDIATTIEQLIEAGAAGVNLEDGDFAEPSKVLDAEQHADQIRAARAAGERQRVPLWINARTDIFWKAIGEEATRVDEAIRRLSLYAEAGADSGFAPNLASESDIRAVAGGIDIPLNVLRLPGMASAEELGAMGVARITFGADVLLATLEQVERIGNLLRGGDLTPLDRARPSGELIRALVAG